MKNKFPKCSKGEQSDCFACDGGCCTILMDTDFNRACPFYKSKQKAMTDREMARNKQIYSVIFDDWK